MSGKREARKSAQKTRGRNFTAPEIDRMLNCGFNMDDNDLFLGLLTFVELHLSSGQQQWEKFRMRTMLSSQRGGSCETLKV